MDEMWEGADIRGFEKFWQGSTIWLLLGLFALVNLFIMFKVFGRGIRGWMAVNPIEE